MLTPGPGQKLVYRKASVEILATQVPNDDKMSWLVEELNKVGQGGEFPVTVNESFRQSSIQVATAKGPAVVPYYVVDFILCKVAPADETEE